MQEYVLEMKDVGMAYGGQPVIRGLSLHLGPGQIGCLLGESGCGKTSVLRTIAGFEKVQSGSIRLGGSVVSDARHCLAPAKRGIGMVFQDYALFPHLSVAENVAFGVRGVAADARRLRAAATLDMVGLGQAGNKYPHELSGGQQQRVALARALATRPRLLLMDEPFSNLDVTLRERLSTEVRAILKQCGTTALFVTHNQMEAFALADVIGVMRHGVIDQWDTASHLYHTPRSRFVAGFVGEGRFIAAVRSGAATLDTALGPLAADLGGLPENFNGALLVRPEDIIPDDAGPLRAVVRRRTFRGPTIMYDLTLAGNETVQALVPSSCEHGQGETIGIRVAIRRLVLFHRQTGALAACLGPAAPPAG
jgi:iron(III) transport system ATP-binding protein